MKYIIDSHCHIYPTKIASKAVDAISDFYSAAMYGDGTIDNLSERNGIAGITHSVIFSVATTPQQVKSINEFIATSVKNSNGSLIGLGTLHPDSEDLQGDIDHLVELGLKGVKIHPDFIHTDICDEKLMKIYELIEGRLPVLFHCGDFRFNYSNPDKLEKVIKAFPKLTIVAAHFGGWGIWRQATEALCKYENLFVDTSSSFFALTSDEAVSCIRKFGADRVLFASDFPMWDPVAECNCMKRLALTDEEKEKIFWKNAVKVFKLDI